MLHKAFPDLLKCACLKTSYCTSQVADLQTIAIGPGSNNWWVGLINYIFGISMGVFFLLIHFFGHRLCQVNIMSCAQLQKGKT